MPAAAPTLTCVRSGSCAAAGAAAMARTNATEAERTAHLRGLVVITLWKASSRGERARKDLTVSCAMRVVRFIAPLTLTALLTSAAQAQPGVAEPGEETRATIQASLDNWETICRRFLRIDPEPLPWMIFYDD